jgi:hypothetical protein
MPLGRNDRSPRQSFGSDRCLTPCVRPHGSTPVRPGGRSYGLHHLWGEFRGTAPRRRASAAVPRTASPCSPGELVQEARTLLLSVNGSPGSQSSLQESSPVRELDRGAPTSLAPLLPHTRKILGWISPAPNQARTSNQVPSVLNKCLPDYKHQIKLDCHRFDLCLRRIDLQHYQISLRCPESSFDIVGSSCEVRQREDSGKKISLLPGEARLADDVRWAMTKDQARLQQPERRGHHRRRTPR